MERRASLRILSWPHLVALVAMLAAAGLAIALTPKKVDASGGAFDLNALVPKEFGEWREVRSAFRTGGPDPAPGWRRSRTHHRQPVREQHPFLPA